MGKCISKPREIGECNENNHKIEDKIITKEYRNLKILKNFEMNSIAMQQVEIALQNNHLFRNLNSDEINVITSKLKMCIVEAGAYVFEQGWPGSLFFVINSGSVEVIVDNKSRSILSKGSCFGELALLSDSIRKASIKAVSKSSFWVLSNKDMFKSLKNIPPKDLDKKKVSISKVSYFSKYSESKKDQIAKLSNYHKYEENEIIMHEGDDGTSLFIIQSGTVKLQLNGVEIIRLNKQGETIGEGGIMFGSKRQSTAIAIGRTEIISIDKNNLQTVFGESYINFILQGIAKYAIIFDPYFQFLQKNEIKKIIEKLTWKTYENSSIVINKEDKNHKTILRVICSGSIVSVCSQKHKLFCYQVVGWKNPNEISLSTDNYISEGDAIIGEIRISEIETLLGVTTHTLFDELDKINLLKKLNAFHRLSLASFKFFAKNLESYKFKPGMNIFLEDDPSDCLFIIKLGAVEISKSNKKIRILRKHEIFGERCLIKAKRTATATTIEYSEIYALSRECLTQIKDIRSLELEVERKRYYQKDINLDDIIVKYQYKTASDRCKYCISSKKDRILYDLLVIPKCKISTKLSCFALISEKEVLLELDHYLLIKLVCTSLDEENIYFITEHVDGCSLRDISSMTEEYTKYLVIFLSIVLEYLHGKDIIHRDFCTDYIWISDKGIPYLTDFRNSKITTNRSYTRIGNSFYRSPEMILGRGCTKSTDYWSLGILLYEITYGYLPFTIKYDDKPVVVYEKILKVMHGIDPLKGDSLNALILGLLTDEKERFGINEIRNSPWVNNINTEEIINNTDYQIPQKFLPKINHQIQGQNSKQAPVVFRKVINI